MICYKDRTFCRFYLLCKDGHGCERAATPEVKEAANKADLPICYYAEFTECFVPWFEPDKTS